MINGLAQRTRESPMREAADLAPLPDVTYVGFGVKRPEDPLSPRDEVGIAIPGAMAFLGLAFVCCVVLVAGLPPFSGFVAKFALLRSALDGAGMEWHALAFCAAVLATGVATLVALIRVGLGLFWAVKDRTTPRLRVIEAAPAGVLILLSLALTAGVGPVMTYLDSAARSLHSPQVYVRVVGDTAHAIP